ncbi:hypothetical protein BLS_005514 [Venturia inaequalis]|uniref:Uncharacterized protein n=1 Tax=Venturia inaequalis TaxID=5025 RepID=A0A8H3UEG7_VENIN|nr:hypothetical protein BLS_005514 [Venturia inaequalis]KAE9980103.1 hypothetical protein EG328_000468 [Venturia inaequalis]RDI89264.1 hypothetical protein Vi05172_g246 [Venturia inaequalis]
MFRLWHKTVRCPPGRRYIDRIIRPSITRPSAWQIALPVALGAAATSHALFALNTSSPTDHQAIFSRWNFPNVEWKYSPRLSSGETLAALEADWAYSTTREARTTAVMKLLFAWFDAHRIDGHDRKVRFSDTEMFTALAACQIAKREFISMETANLMWPNHYQISKHIDDIEKELWDLLRSKGPREIVGDVNQASDEVKLACAAAVVVKILHDRCDVEELIEITPVDSPKKEERLEEILMNCEYWRLTSPAERILMCEMMGLAAVFMDKTEIWEEAKKLGHHPFHDDKPEFVDEYMSLVYHLIRRTRQEIQKETVQIIVK